MTTRSLSLSWFLQELIRAILKPIAVILLALGALLLPTLALWAQSGFGFLTSRHEISGWVIALGVGVILSALVVFTHQQVRIRELKPKNPIPFHWAGLDWELPPSFRIDSQHYMVADVAPSHLKHIVKGPFCMNCKRDVTSFLVPEALGSGSVIPIAANSCGCGRRFDPALLTERLALVAKGGMAPDKFLQNLRGFVYRDAQAAARKQEL